MISLETINPISYNLHMLILKQAVDYQLRGQEMNFSMNTIFVKRSKIWLAGLIIVLINILFSAGCSTFSVPEITPTELPREPLDRKSVV